MAVLPVPQLVTKDGFNLWRLAKSSVSTPTLVHVEVAHWALTSCGDACLRSVSYRTMRLLPQKPYLPHVVTPVFP